MLLLLLESSEDLGLLPSSEKAKTLGSDSTQETQKNPTSFLEMAKPENHPLGVLRISSKTLMKLPLKF